MHLRTDNLPQSVVAAIAAAVAVVMDSQPDHRWRITAISPVPSGLNPWTLAGRLQIMAGRSSVQSRRTRS